MKKNRLSWLLIIISALVVPPNMTVLALDTDYFVAVPFKYGEARSFSEGMAAVCDLQSGKWGFIDKTGAEVVPPKYDDVLDFSEGMARVRIFDWKMGPISGFIDKTGKEIIPLKYGDAQSFCEGVAWVRSSDQEFVEVWRWGIIDKNR